ncbi:MAG: pentapeptide repeat-containing protein [Pseudomonadota bacterium]
MIDPAFAGAGMLGKLTSKFSTGRTMEKAEAPASTGKEPWWGQVTLAVGAVDESSKLTRGLFTYFLTLSAYVAIAVFGTTQETLLLNAGIELPIIGTQVPVVEFYILAPAFVVAFHLNLLIKLWSLKKKAEEQTRQLATRFDGEDGEAVHAFQNLLYPYDFTMVVAGPKGRHIIRGAMAFVITLTIFLGPLALLFITMQRFAPVGIGWMTLLHGGLVILDAVFLIIFRFGLRRAGHLRALIGTVAQSLVLLLIGGTGIMIAMTRVALFNAAPPVAEAAGAKTIESIAYERWRGRDSVLGLSGKQQGSIAGALLPRIGDSTTYCLINPDVAPTICPGLRSGTIANDTLSPFTEAQRAGRQRLSDATKQLCNAASGRFNTQLNLSGRQMRFAQLRNAVAPCVLLSGSDLTAADLFGAHLAKAKLPSANLTHADLTLANLSETDMTLVTFDGTVLAGANLSGAYLGMHGMSLDQRPQLQDINLIAADLSDTRLVGANLSGADMKSAKLVGTILNGGRLQQAELQFTDIVNADFFEASLEDARLEQAYLSGSHFSNASLRDVNFYKAQVVNSVLRGTTLIEADFRFSLLFGVDIAKAVASGAQWPESIPANEHLLIADNACFAPLIRMANSNSPPASLCVPQYTGRDYELGESNAQALAPLTPETVLVSPEHQQNVESFMQEAACVRSPISQPIGPDGQPMNLKPCFHQNFRERIQAYACGQLRRQGVQSMQPGSLFGQPFESEYLATPNPVIITEDSCAAIGLGTEWEMEWLQARFPTLEPRTKLDYTGARIPT